MNANLQDLKLDASDIARRIDHLAELMLDCDDSEFARLAEKNKYYWNLAARLGLADEVDAILQNQI
jgi:hypothetical protein